MNINVNNNIYIYKMATIEYDQTILVHTKEKERYILDIVTHESNDISNDLDIDGNETVLVLDNKTITYRNIIQDIKTGKVLQHIESFDRSKWSNRYFMRMDRFDITLSEYKNCEIGKI